MANHSVRSLFVVYCLAVSSTVSPQAGAAGPADPFSGARDEVAARTALPSWNRLLARDWATEPEADTACAARIGRDCGFASWRRFMERNAGLDADTQIRNVHAFVNRVAYVEDRDLWGRNDYWAAPGEFFARGGDCEDYAIAKYMTLRRLGFPARDLRILVMHDTWRGPMHAVLLVHLEGRVLVLDNNAAQVQPFGEMARYVPLYSFNDDEVRLYTRQPS